MKATAIHQPNYLPWIGYFYKIAFADTFVFLDNVDYQYGNSSSVINRAKIKTNSGIQLLSVPVKKLKGAQFIKDMPIDNSQPWQRKHLNAIRLNYAKSQFFSPVFKLLEEVIENKFDTLSELNMSLIQNICNYLSMQSFFLKASSLSTKETDKNLRLINICKETGANIYLSGKGGGLQYNDSSLFLSNGITIEYSKFEHPVYKQLFGTFIPNLSIIDALFNEGINTNQLFMPLQF